MISERSSRSRVSLRRAQQRRALDSSGPFCSKPSYQEGKAYLGTGTLGAAILVPFFAATDKQAKDPEIYFSPTGF
jgi:hypothetical protein